MKPHLRQNRINQVPQLAGSMLHTLMLKSPKTDGQVKRTQTELGHGVQDLFNSHLDSHSKASKIGLLPPLLKIEHDYTLLFPDVTGHISII